MLQKHPEQRPTADEILQHPWLQCSKTLERVNRLYNMNDTLMNSSEEQDIDLTMVNVSLSETDKSVMQPPPKRRRIE
jgi:serine/threonine protein kinase